MDHDIPAPDLGPSSDEWTLTAWLKEIGDAVEEEEVIAEVMTEKANVEVLSPAAGVLVARHVEVDEVGKPGDVLGVVRAA